MRAWQAWKIVVAHVQGWRGVMRGRLNRRLLLWFLSFSIIPLIVTNAVGYRRSHDIIRRQVQRALISIATVQAEHVSDRVERHLLLLDAIVAGNEFLKAGALHARGLPAGEMADVATPEAMTNLLRAKREELPAFNTLYLYTPDGAVLASSGASGDILPVVPRQRRTATLTVGMSGEPKPEPEFRLVAPLTSAHAGIVAYLAGTVRVGGFRDFLQLPEHFAGRGRAYIVDLTGRPIFATDPADHVDYTRPLANPLVAAAARDTGEYADASGVEQIGAIADVPNHPWKLLVEVPAGDAFGELRALGGLSLVLELALVAVLVALAWVVAAEIVAPLRRLVDATQRIGAGELSVRVHANEEDEIGELGRAFNEMTTELASTTRRVKQLHAREIERASQLATVGELASGIAHEIKNPVVGVSNGLDLVRRRIGDDPVLTPITNEMSRQLARIQQAMQELLTFARPAEPALGPVNAEQLLSRALRLVQPTADRAGVLVEVQVDPTLAALQADDDMLHQALVNVLMNAVQATPTGGRVWARAFQSGDDVRIEIADTGRGVPPELLDTVFKPFFTTRHTGTGLGLPITREIVQRHGGSVSLDSVVGVGTTVVLRLPLTPACEDAEEAVLT